MSIQNLLKSAFIASTVLLTSATTAFAGAHGNSKFTDVDKLQARQGNWSAEETAKGREQLVRAFDAAWIEVVDSGKYLEILSSEPESQPGAAKSYFVRLADCLPQPENYAYPEKPVGMFKDILESGVIRTVVQGVPETPANTSWYFSRATQRMQDEVLAIISKHYGVELKLEQVVLRPGRLPATSLLADNKIDFISQLNAVGGDTQGIRRRTSRRFSCTMAASSQFIHIPEKSPLVKEITSLGDLMAKPEVTICAGPLTTQTARAFLPEHTVKTKYVNDLTACDKDIAKGKVDIIMNPLHDLNIAGLKGYKSVHTLIVAGTPLWVAKEGIVCEDDGNPRTEDHCKETDAP